MEGIRCRWSKNEISAVLTVKNDHKIQVEFYSEKSPVDLCSYIKTS